MTDSALHERASALFVELRALPAARRAAALAAATQGQPRLAAEVASLLAHDVDDGSDGGDTALPDRIGPYRILSRLGSGGSGQVFLAEQEQPIRRRVAIKVVPLAAVSPESAARFEVERAALEATDHPHIARVLDAGRTADGLPYLVMNYIEGEPLNVYCKRRGLPLASRVQLLLDVADAVQHAHQRGVIHRDLKPANILVTEADGRASPQVLDFGIAKPVAGTFPVDSPPTLGLPMGTPAYMAPEQTRLGAIDTRADVYALGAILYELVAGRPPIDVSGDAVGALSKLRDVLPQPASRVREQSLAHAREPVAAPGPATRAFLADLDVVLDKALEKQPERRYASVGALMDDLRRLLACEPIAARAPTWGYRAARFARRNRLAVAAGAVAFVALGVGVFVLATLLLEAQRQRAAAENQFEAQVEINTFLTDDLLAQATPDAGGPNMTVKEMLDRASANVDQRFTGRPLIAAAIHHSLGEAYAQLSNFEAAEPHLAQAVALRSRAAGTDAQETVVSELAAASLLVRRERLDEAEAALIPAIARARLILGPDRLELYAAMNNLALVLLSRERIEDAHALLREALAAEQRLLPPHAPQIIETLNSLAQLRSMQGDNEGSLALLLEALTLAQSSPDEPRMTLLGLENNVGATLQDLDRNAEAEPHLRASAEMAAELLGPQHPATLTIEANVAGLQADLGQTDTALETFTRVIEGQTALFGAQAQDTLTSRHGYWSALLKAQRAAEAAAGFTQLLADVTAALGAQHSLAAQTEISLAHALVDAGRAAEALPHAQAAQQQLTALFGADNPRAAGARALVESIQSGK